MSNFNFQHISKLVSKAAFVGAEFTGNLSGVKNMVNNDDVKLLSGKLSNHFAFVVNTFEKPKLKFFVKRN
jgi:hypothetical protein